MYRQGPSGPGLDQDQTDLDGPWRSRSRSQNFCLGPDCPVSGPAKMAWDRTRPNFPNTNWELLAPFIDKSSLLCWKAIPDHLQQSKPPDGTSGPLVRALHVGGCQDGGKVRRALTSDAGVRCGAVQRPFLPNHAPNCGAGSVHAPNRAPHQPAPVRSGAEGFSAQCTGFEQGPIGQKKAFLNVAMDLQVHPDRTYFVTSSKDKTARVC